MREDPSEINEVWERVLEGDRVPADDAIDDVDKPSPIRIMDRGDDRDLMVLRINAPSSTKDIAHFCIHLPKCDGCDGCLLGKTCKSPSRRRAAQGATVTAQDAVDRPFGAMVHMHHIVMKPGSRAAGGRSAP